MSLKFAGVKVDELDMTTPAQREAQRETRREEKEADKGVDRRISLWASQAAANERNSSIAERRLSLHINRRSLQSGVHLTVSQPEGVGASAEEQPRSGDKEGLVTVEEGPEEQYDVDDEDDDGEYNRMVFTSDVHREMYILVKSYLWQLFILTVILVNTVALIIQTSVYTVAKAGWYMEVLECVFVAIFLMEAIIQIYVYRLSYFFNPLFILDLIIVTFNVLDIMLSIANLHMGSYGATTIFRLLRIVQSFRALRLFRVLQPFRFFSTLQVILLTLERSVVPMSIIALMMTYVIYLFAVIGRGLYGEVDFRFRTIPKTMFTLYLQLTLDDWYFMPMEIEQKGIYTNFYFMMIYFIVNVYIFLDLLVAVICDNFEEAWVEEIEVQRQRKLKHTGSFSNMQQELEEHDEEESLLIAVTAEGDGAIEYDFDGDDDVDNDLNARSIQDYYPAASEQEQQVLEHFFNVAAALENSYFKMMEMQHVLDMMVDVSADAGDDAA